MKFEAGSFIHLWWLIPLLVLFYVYVEKQKKKALQKFSQTEILKKLLPSVSRKKQVSKKILLVLATCFILFSLLKPMWGYRWENIKRKGIDIFILIDVSRSMLAQDIKPNRLERAKREIKDLIKILKGDRIGLIPFAGTSFVSCPLTLDYSTARLFLDDITINTIPTGGTNIKKAIQKSINSFKGEENNDKVIILISDGEENEEETIQAAELAKMKGIKIYCVGIGSAQGEPIPIIDEEGNKSFLKDKKGKVVFSRLNEDILQKTALITGGAYIKASYGNLNLEEIYNKQISHLNKRELNSLQRKRYTHRFQFFLGIAILLLYLEILINECKQKALKK